MAQCLSLNGQYLVIDSTPVDQCTGFIALNRADYQQFVTVTNENSLVKVFSTFEKENFGVGFGGVLALFVAGLIVGIITNLIRKAR